ncbi:MAG: hypothetical protein OCD02_07275 [Spirochaetaceae bacterium]
MKIDKKTVKKWSEPFRYWHYYPSYVIPGNPGIKGHEDIKMVDVPTVYQLPGDDNWYMSFIGFNGQGYQSFVCRSSDLVSWTDFRLAMGFGKKGEFDFGGCVIGSYLYESYDIKARRTLKQKDEKYWTLYGSYAKQGGYELDPGYEGVASSVDGLCWQQAKESYILSIHETDVGAWEKDCIYQPWLVEFEGKYYNFYNAKEMPQWIEQIGLATSEDLMNWQRHSVNPIIKVSPLGYDSKFASDAKVFRDGDHWVMFYFGVGLKGAHIMAAYSWDLIHWTVDPEPLYKAGGHPAGLDEQYAHKISLVWNPVNKTFYMYYNGVQENGRGIALITSKPI